MKAHRGRRCTVPFIPNFLTTWRCVVSFTPQPLYGHVPWYLWDTKFGGPQRRTGRFGEERNLLPLWNSNPGPSLVAIQTQQPSLVTNWRDAREMQSSCANHDKGHLWVAASRTSVAAYRRFGETCCLNFQSILTSESADSSELGVSIHGIISQNTSIWTHYHLSKYQYLMAVSIFMFIRLCFCVA